jgi:hypothetical protein
MSSNTEQPKICESAEDIHNHNKGIFHIGQCPHCYQSNVINPLSTAPKEVQGEVKRERAIDLLTNAIPYIEEKLSQETIGALCKQIDSYMDTIFSRHPAPAVVIEKECPSCDSNEFKRMTMTYLKCVNCGHEKMDENVKEHSAGEDWISVEDDLPAVKKINSFIACSEPVLLYIDRGEIAIGWRKEYISDSKDPLFPQRIKGYYMFENTQYKYESSVTHWKKLPEPPKK